MTPEPAGDDAACRDAQPADPTERPEDARLGGPRGDGPGSASVGAPDRGAAAVRATADDPLVAARIALEDVGELPLEHRAEVFERVHATVVEELRQLELG